MLIKESILRRIIREEAVRALREDDLGGQRKETSTRPVPRPAFEANLAKELSSWKFAALAEEQTVSFTYKFGGGS